jgi:hypothetical protein
VVGDGLLCVPVVRPHESAFISEPEFHKACIANDHTLQPFQFVNRDAMNARLANRSGPPRGSAARRAFTLNREGRLRVAEQKECRGPPNEVLSCATNDLAGAGVESFVNDNLLDEPVDKGTKDAYAERGFIHVPASGSHGGVIATGGIRRDATLGLAALRQLSVGDDKEKTLALRRYVLGLALTAFTYNPSGYLRQGCLLVLDPSKAKEREFVEVHPTGERKPAAITHDAALKFATEAANAFGVGPSRTVEFDKERAKRDVKGEGGTKSKKRKDSKAAATPNAMENT